MVDPSARSWSGSRAILCPALWAHRVRLGDIIPHRIEPLTNRQELLAFYRTPRRTVAKHPGALTTIVPQLRLHAVDRDRRRRDRIKAKIHNIIINYNRLKERRQAMEMYLKPRVLHEL